MGGQTLNTTGAQKGWLHYGLGLVRSHEDMILELWPEVWEVCGMQEVYFRQSVDNKIIWLHLDVVKIDGVI